MSNDEISFEEVRKAIAVDLAEIKVRDEKKEKVEACIFFVCLFVSSMLLVAKMLVDLAPWVMTFPSARVIAFRMFDKFGS